LEKVKKRWRETDRDIERGRGRQWVTGRDRERQKETDRDKQRGILSLRDRQTE
jgi:hypothetical protein